MGERHVSRGTRRSREFEAFVAGAAGRLLQSATLLTAEAPDDNPRACRLLTVALAHTYARWDGLRGEDPYDAARQELAARYAHGAWCRGRVRGRAAGLLAPLTPQERLVVVLRLYEGVGEEQVAAQLGLPTERIRLICDRATALLLHPRRPRPAAPAPGAAGAEVAAS
ncbi:sigma factor-like helix-turn-helix DNA-binding protein [Streptomyces sp. NPDC047000]|uniref:sigma factor-like helix-turn-helix DNA-binding protein n=1 Tax=Streptomyces sp. NPDC047000 TaxID=3155474 RepID=UPI00340CC0DD